MLSPHQYVGEDLELHAGDTLITVYFRQQSVALHPRAFGRAPPLNHPHAKTSSEASAVDPGKAEELGQ